jgi:hypothetical protein
MDVCHELHGKLLQRRDTWNGFNTDKKRNDEIIEEKLPKLLHPNPIL